MALVLLIAQTHSGGVWREQALKEKGGSRGVCQPQAVGGCGDTGGVCGPCLTTRALHALYVMMGSPVSLVGQLVGTVQSMR